MTLLLQSRPYFELSALHSLNLGRALNFKAWFCSALKLSWSLLNTSLTYVCTMALNKHFGIVAIGARRNLYLRFIGPMLPDSLLEYFRQYIS
jgi:hypothetical protein